MLWAGIAYANVCFSEGHVTLDALKSFVKDVEAKFKGPVDLSTVDWLWERLAATGPHGKQYRERFEPAYLEEVYGITSAKPDSKQKRQPE